MNEITTGQFPVKWDVFVAKRESATRNIPPGKEELMWVAGSSTLIYGERDAVLVDTQLTIDANRALARWITQSGKNLTTIYITHGHGDHFFGIRELKTSFPRARAVATANTVKLMRRQASPEYVASFWGPRYPGQIPENLVIAEELESQVIQLEGTDLVSVELGHTDTEHTTCLHVPSIGLVAAGDAAYNDTHLYLGESNAQTRQEWIAALDKLDYLNPSAVIAGHKRPERDDDPRIIEETRQYIRDFNKFAQATNSARELYERMLDLYPNRVNPGSLWGAAQAAKEG